MSEDNLLQNGAFRARAIRPTTNPWCRSSNGNEQAVITFQLLEGPNEGKQLQRYFSFTDAASQYSIDALFAAGWDGKDIVTLDGLGDNECSVVLKDEEYKGKVTTRVKYVNDIGGGAQDPMGDSEAKEFGLSLRGTIMAVKEEREAKGRAKAAGDKELGF